MESFTSRSELIDWIHAEISAQGTSSVFWGHGLDKRTGAYDAEKIADRIISGKLKIKNVTYKAQ